MKADTIWRGKLERCKLCKSGLDIFFVADVKYAAIKMENGKSKGCGMVVFNTSDDARRAVGILSMSKVKCKVMP